MIKCTTAPPYVRACVGCAYYDEGCKSGALHDFEVVENGGVVPELEDVPRDEVQEHLRVGYGVWYWRHHNASYDADMTVGEIGLDDLAAMSGHLPCPGGSPAMCWWDFWPDCEMVPTSGGEE